LMSVLVYISAPSAIYLLSLHDALPIWAGVQGLVFFTHAQFPPVVLLSVSDLSVRRAPVPVEAPPSDPTARFFFAGFLPPWRWAGNPVRPDITSGSMDEEPAALTTTYSTGFSESWESSPRRWRI